MKYIGITLENSVLEAEFSTLLDIKYPAKNYTKLFFSTRPSILEGYEPYYLLEKGEWTLLVSTKVKMSFYNYSKVEPVVEFINELLEEPMFRHPKDNNL